MQSVRSYTIYIRLIVMSYPIMPSLDQFSNVDRKRERLLADLAALEMAGTSELCLNYRHLKDIPDELAGNSYCQISLIKLYLKGNLINEMPCQLQQLRNLKELYLPSNALQHLPSELNQLSALESLNVSSNELTSLPPAIGKMANLKCLNITSNKIAVLPDELWEAPHLEQLLASSNRISSLSPSILRCQSLHTLVLDSNHFTQLPTEITRLLNLKRLSVCGNDLTSLPSDFSALCKLEVVYVDGNSRLHSIPASLIGVKSVGVQGCNVSFWNHMTASGMSTGHVLRLLAPHGSVPPLMEQAATSVHISLISAFPPLSPCPYQVSLLPSFLPIPTTLSPWLAPRGRCLSPSCSSPFFHHHYSYLVSLLTFQNLNTLPKSHIECKLPSDVSVCLDFCSLHCAQSILAEIL